MGKNKRAFSFGIFSGKKERKGKHSRLYNSFGILLAAAVILQSLPFEGVTVSASESRAV